MDKRSEVATTPPRRTRHLVDHLTTSLASKTRYWWLLLIAGAIWIAMGLAISRFAYETITALAKLVGVLCLVAAASEVLVGATSSKGGRIARSLLAVLFVLAGVVAFLGVKATIVGLAAVMSFLFVVWGVIGVLVALAAKREHAWWVLALASLAELAIGLSIAGSLKMPIMTLLTWTTAGTLVHGIEEIASAFVVRRTGRHAAAAT
jgi:uncharacterized membrane protein HdeD (DUF308 family)